ncbi:MAG: hypothetical protein ACK4GT_16620 [Pararhodobacter sp.]
MIRLSLAALVLAATSLPAPAQWIAVGRWGSEREFRHVPPGTWMVRDEGDSIAISAEGDHHQGRLEFWCSAGDPAGRLRFSGYRGDGLPVPFADGGPVSHPVQFVIGAQHFDRVFDYRPAERDWLGPALLDPDFLEVFAAGQRMDLLDAGGERITSFRLAGSRAARVAVQQSCGL